MHAIIDAGKVTDASNYYQTFPGEPTIKPDSDFAITLNAQGKIDPADLLNPMSVASLTDRLLALGEDRALIVCHGTPGDGLAIPLINNPAPNAPTATPDALHDINQYAVTRDGIAAIKKLPAKTDQDAAKQAKAIMDLLNNMRTFTNGRYFDPPLSSGQKSGDYEALFSRLLDRDATNKKYSRAQLDQLIDKRQKLQGKFARIEVRACNIGKNPPYMKVLREFLGARELVAPKVVHFGATFTVDVDANFSTAGFDRETRGVIGARGHQPQRVDAQGTEVSIPFPGIPPTRSFDVNSAPGDDVFMRQWLVRVHPHVFEGWMAAKNVSFVRDFIKQKIFVDDKRYKDRAPLPLEGMWLVEDDNTPFTIPNTSPDPLAPPTVTLPSFALPLEKEYRQFLVCNPP
jgi:hypothetical protein